MDSIYAIFGMRKGRTDLMGISFIVLISLVGTLYMYQFIGLDPYDVLIPRDFSDISKDSYIRVVEPFLEGRLHMWYSPPKRCPFDFSFYDGRCYMYWNPLMAFLSLPLIVLFDLYIGAAFLMLLLFFLSSLIGCLIIYHISMDYFENVPRWAVYVCMSVFNLNFLLPHMSMKRFSIFLIPQLGAGFFLLLGIFIVLVNSKRGNTLLSLLAGLSLGFVVCNRPTLSIASMLIICSYPFYLRICRTPFLRNFLVCAFGFFIIMSSLMLYNIVRFDDPFEFGVNYQNNAMVTGGFMKPHYDNILTGFWHYLFQYPALSGEKPYLHGRFIQQECKRSRDDGLFCSLLLEHAAKYMHTGKRQIGFIYLMPFMLPVYLAPLYIVFSLFFALIRGDILNRFYALDKMALFFYTMFFSAFFSLIVLSLFRGYLTRYFYDIIHFCSLASSAAYFHLFSSFSGLTGKKRVFRIIFDLVFLSLSVLTLILIITGDPNALSFGGPHWLS